MINRLLFGFAILLAAMASSHAFTSTDSRRVLKGTSQVQRSENTKLAAAKKAATKSKKSEEEEVVNFKKPEFVAAVAEKTGMTKGDSEKALSAVLNVIASVSRCSVCN
jgi:malic enzyme